MSSAYMSNAKLASLIGTPMPALLISKAKSLIKMANSMGKSESPCLTPDWTGNQYVYIYVCVLFYILSHDQCYFAWRLER